MAFLKLNNFEIPVSDADWVEEQVEIGQEDGRGAAGLQVQSDTRAFKRRWTGETILLSAQDAEATELWIQGQMFHVGFERGLQSEGGLCPDAGYAGGIASTSAKYGSRCLFCATSGATMARYRIPVRTRTNDYAVSLWLRDNVGGIQKHLAVLSRQGVVTRYLDGIVTGSSGTVTVDSPTSNAIRFTLLALLETGGASTNFRVDDVVMAAWPFSVDQVAALATGTRAFSEAPVMEASGDFLRETGPVLVRGLVTSEAYTQVQDPTLGWDDNQRPVSFSLEEV